MGTVVSPPPLSSSGPASGDDDGVGRRTETTNKKEERGGLGLALGFAKDFAAGGLAGVTSTVVFQPFDVVKTHIQGSSSSPPPRVTEIVRLILSRSGVRGLWRGTVPACIRVGLGAGLYFTMLGPVLSVLSTGSFVQANTAGSAESLKSKLPVHVTLAAGAITRSIAASVVCPITVIKTRMEYEAVSGLHYSNTAKALMVVGQTEGLKGLYSGLLPTILRDAPYSGLYLLLYNRTRHRMSEWQGSETSPHFSANFFAGAMAGAGATVLTHPPDVIRTKMQLESSNQTGILSTVRFVYKVHGLRGFFAGVVPRAGRRALHQAFSWTIFEEIMKHRLS